MLIASSKLPNLEHKPFFGDQEDYVPHNIQLMRWYPPRKLTADIMATQPQTFLNQINTQFYNYKEDLGVKTPYEKVFQSKFFVKGSYTIRKKKRKLDNLHLGLRFSTIVWAHFWSNIFFFYRINKFLLKFDIILANLYGKSCFGIHFVEELNKSIEKNFNALFLKTALLRHRPRDFLNRYSV